MILLGSFAILALLLTIVGIYGVIAYSVSRQTHYIGVRMALGARRLAVLGSVLKEAAALLGAGVVIGLVATIASDSLLRNMVYGVSQSDARIFAFSVALVVTSGLIAAIVPAFRAATINPVQALRNE
jgi:macrolide transport system ATP-binding/permease protein